MSASLLNEPIELAAVRSIEEAAFDAWPALTVAQVDGWRLRAAEGITGRANSVWALHDEGALSLEAKLAAAEDFYRVLGLPPMFQINAAVQPSYLDAHLDARGYSLRSPTLVQSAPLAAIRDATPALRFMPDADVEVAEGFDDEWFATYRLSAEMDEHTAAVRSAILRQIAAPCAFALLRLGGEPAGVGLGVVGGAWLGIFCMETLPAFRRRGAATALLRTLAIWAALHDARSAYLQVKATNSAALGAYARAAFRTAYGYHYRVLE